MIENEIDPNDLEPRFILYVSVQELVAIGAAVIIAKQVALLPIADETARLIRDWEALDSFSRKALATLKKDKNTRA